MSTLSTLKQPASLPAHLTQTSVGKKILTAVTGFIAFGFVFGHMVGNLQVLIGQDQYNTYAETLQGLGALLWVIRGFLLLAFGIHIWLGIQLKLENWAARPVAYKNETTQQASLASRTMIWTGLIVVSFVIYHLLHFTVRTTNPEYADLTDSLGRVDVHSMVVLGFSSYLISAFYLLSVGLLCYHLSHGVASMFQSLGLNSPKWQKRLDVLAWLAAIVLFAGYAAVPVAVMLKLVSLPGGGI
ncbi:MAG: succinate dehydrogenase cytochrome b subunit [bacterium]|nr:succinate dehydrogenase cytochrome b subunit [bacterium]